MIKRLAYIAAAAFVAAGLVVGSAGAAGATTIVGHPQNPSNIPNAIFTFTSTGTTFTCTLDGGTPDPSCTSPASYAGLADGPHTFDVLADDGSSDSFIWTVDTVPPTTTIATGPSGTVASASATFTFTSSEPGTFQCSLDGAAFGPCVSGVSYGGLAQGAHTFAVRAVDTAGNTDASPATASWTVDTVPPTTTIATGPSGTVATASATFTFTSSEPGTFQCSLDGAAFGPCVSGVSYGGLAQGAHTFAVRAVDTAGNTDASPATASWTVDTVPPTTTIATGPSGTVASASATFTFTSSEPGTFQCKLDGAAFAPCSSGVSYSSLAEGPHSFSVAAVDAVGNVDTSPATAAWTVDTVPPTTTIVTGPSGTVASASATFTFTSSEPGTFQCKLDGAAFAPCSSGVSYSSLAEGPHSFSVAAVDAVGNVDTSPATRPWTVDTVGPTVTITGGPTGTVGGGPATLTFTVSEPAATTECQVDAGAFAPCTSPFSIAPLASGAHTVGVRATDAVGNTGAVTSRAWTVDATPPVLSVPANKVVEANGPGGTAVGYIVTASDGGNALLPDAIACSPASGSTFGLGVSTVACIATDAFGNIGNASFTVTVRDTTAPVINAPDVQLAATSTSGIQRSDPALAGYLSHVSAVDLVSAVTLTSDTPDLLPLGQSTITFTAHDAAGNVATKSVKVVVVPQGQPVAPPDLTPPSPVTAARAKAGDHTVTLKWNPPALDLAYVRVTAAVVGAEGAPKVVFKGTARQKLLGGLRNDVEYRFVLVAVDRAGNESSPTVIMATPTAKLLALPKPNARVLKPPLLRWAPVLGASYFNVQLYRGTLKVLSAFPVFAKVQLVPRWLWDGKVRQLTPGTYTWYVWPGLGARSDVHYGPLLGKSTFVVAKPPTKRK